MSQVLALRGCTPEPLMAYLKALGIFRLVARTAEYVSRHAGGNVTTEDLVAVAEEIAGRDLDGLFDSWLFGETTPPPPGMNSGLGSQTAPSPGRAIGEGCPREHR